MPRFKTADAHAYHNAEAFLSACKTQLKLDAVPPRDWVRMVAKCTNRLISNWISEKCGLHVPFEDFQEIFLMRYGSKICYQWKLTALFSLRRKNDEAWVTFLDHFESEIGVQDLQSTDTKCLVAAFLATLP